MTLFQLRPMTAGDEAIPLYDFQREALDAIYKRRAEGITRPMIVIPTGGGKTLFFVALSTTMVSTLLAATEGFGGWPY